MECCEYGRLSIIANTSLCQVGLCSRLILDFTSWMRAQRNYAFHGFFPSLSDGFVSWVRAYRDLHHQFPRGEDDLWALRAGPEDLPESPSEVRGEEHRPGLWIREGVGGALQTCGRASFFTSGVHWWTLPRGQLARVTFTHDPMTIKPSANLNLDFFRRVLRKYWAWMNPESFKTFWQKLRLAFLRKYLFMVAAATSGCNSKLTSSKCKGVYSCSAQMWSLMLFKAETGRPELAPESNLQKVWEHACCGHYCWLL